ncbi:DUF1534 domain-containing protein [Pseudomonas syringae]|nr:DUF1534 domain-containing protein [Pseudomonas syringae]MCF5608324.1 DUF1534 domain-containing protein [Pseudomonas syringae]MCF5614063.1 DUF1534 domain-containing protein [Pseudomonas syringae]MCF5697593.1 DUF1534 domain-containing protein [Pseudomonas syringae]
MDSAGRGMRLVTLVPKLRVILVPTLCVEMPFRDALRHNSALRRTLKVGRRASGNACPRGVGTIIVVV